MKRKWDARRILKITTCMVLFAGLFLQICMLAEISGKAKERTRAEADIRELSAMKDNLELQLVGYQRTTWIEQQAIELGMQWPTDDQLRVISIPQEYEDTTTHTAEITGSK